MASPLLSLTLVDVQEGVAQPAAENRFRQVPEVLLDQVGHVEGRLVIKGDAIRVGLHPLPQHLNAGLDARLPEQTHLVGQDTGSQAIGWKSPCSWLVGIGWMVATIFSPGPDIRLAGRRAPSGCWEEVAGPSVGR